MYLFLWSFQGVNTIYNNFWGLCWAVCSSVYKYYEVIINLRMHSNENLGKTLRVVKDRGVVRPNWFYWVLKKSDQQNVSANSAVALLNCFKDSQRSSENRSHPTTLHFGTQPLELTRRRKYIFFRLFSLPKNGEILIKSQNSPSPGHGLWTLQNSCEGGLNVTSHWLSSMSIRFPRWSAFIHFTVLFWSPRPHFVEHCPN